MLRRALEARLERGQTAAPQGLGLCAFCGEMTRVDAVEDLAKTPCARCGHRHYVLPGGVRVVGPGEIWAPDEDFRRQVVIELFQELEGLLNGTRDELKSSVVETWLWAKRSRIATFGLLPSLRASGLEGLAKNLEELEARSLPGTKAGA